MKFRALLITLLLAFPAMTSAETLKGNLPGCMTADLLDQLMKAIQYDDQKTGDALLHGGGCIITAPGAKVKVIDRSIPGKVEVQAGEGEHTLQMWTLPQNVLP